jgi:hypothetical protein
MLTQIVSDYFPNLVAFATAIIAVLWEAKNKDKVGWRRVTKSGLLILAFAVSSLALNILRIREKNAEAARNGLLSCKQPVPHKRGQMARRFAPEVSFHLRQHKFNQRDI